MSMKKLIQNYWWAMFVIGICLLVLVVFFIVRLTTIPTTSKSESFFSYMSTSSEELDSQNDEEASLWVDVKGAVISPCMYQGETSMRVWDIIQLAGGVKENADTKQVNYSLKIEDQMVIYVPEKGEELSEEMLKKGEVTDVITKQENQQQKINLNQATEQELQNLTGIGQKKAQEIIRYRQENDGFKTIDEIKNISGIGEKTFEKLIDSITI